MKVKIVAVIIVCFGFSIKLSSQDANAIITKVKAKLDKVNDYTADGKMRTNIAFIKAPIGKVKLYYKKPNKLKIVREKGISILPKGGMTFNVASIFELDKFTAIPTGETVISGVKTKIIKLLPLDENSDVVISTLYIDEANLLIKKSATTTRENGSFETEMFYGSLAELGLPDKMILTFNVKDYKMPKGITLEFDDDMSKEEKEKLKTKKGKIEFLYSNYIINKGITDATFK